LSGRARKKKDGQNKKLRRMRAEEMPRHAHSGPERPSRDQADVVPHKPGTASDRTRRGAT
jgi:hypothetical protein